jgi:hypothetical protein
MMIIKKKLALLKKQTIDILKSKTVKHFSIFLMTQKILIQNQKHLDIFPIDKVHFFNNSPFFISETFDITQNNHINSIQEIDFML